MKSKILHGIGCSNVTKWEELVDVEQLWLWLQGQLIPSVYYEDSPGSGLGNVLGYNYLIGTIQLRQVTHGNGNDQHDVGQRGRCESGPQVALPPQIG
eukprot:751172-Hanusia_phi.AAC.3